MQPGRWDRIEQLYHAALERKPREREVFLDEACAGDESLCREVKSLLACRPEAQEFIEAPALDMAARAIAEQTDLTGQTILHYQITEKLGAGGMGVVYRAKDTKLDRQVAIKQLPDIFNSDPERLARFEREARLLASLNHPNIAAIHGLEQAEGKRFLVMELVEGKTLAQRLGEGPVPVEEALDICRQIAEGLEAANEKGIVHRDLKPANVQITPEGKVKILDFGLARVFGDQPLGIDQAHSPTITEAMTGPGVVLGTAAYMSPEQATGKTVDRRADIWSFGVVLWELLTGHRMFEGETVTHTLAEVLRGPIDFDQLPRQTPAAIRDLLRRCLDRNVKNRLRDIGEARITIEATLAGETPLLEGAPEHGGVRRLWLAWSVVAALTVGLATIAFLNFRERPPAPAASVITSTIKVESGHWLDGMRRAVDAQRPSLTAMVISGDGRFVVYCAIEENRGPQAKPQLYLRRMDQAEAKPITGTGGGINPFLSPDNRWVGFWADGKLKKVPVDGGVPDPLADTALIYGASWGPDNTILFADGDNAGLSRVSADGGTPERLTMPDPKREESSHRLPSWLPNGKSVLCTVMRHSFDSQPRIALFRLDTREWHVLLQDAADAKYVSTGHLVFLRQGMLMAVRFDPARLEVIGQPIPLLENVLNTSTNSRLTSEGWACYPIWTPDGKRIVLSWQKSTVPNLFSQPYDGSAPMQPLTTSEYGQFPESWFSFSDGQTLALVEYHADTGYDILMLEVRSGRLRPFLNSQFDEGFPEFSPDGRWIAYSSNESKRGEVYVASFPMAGMKHQVSSQGGEEPLWARNGKQLFYK